MPSRTNALELLHRDHQEVQGLFARAHRADGREKERLTREIADRLREHTRIEKEIFYPFLREATGREDLIEEADIEHASAKQILEELDGAAPGSPRFDALLKVLSEYVDHHVKEEEDTVFGLARKTGVDLEALGAELMEHRRGDGAAPRRSGGAQKGGKADGGNGRAAGARSRSSDEKFLAEHGSELSPSTRRARWIHGPDEHEDHPGETLATRNPEVIRRWAEERQASPATTASGDRERPRVLRFDFGEKEGGLQPVSWDAWLRVFEQRQLVFLFQEHMKAGNTSNFFRLDSPHREEG